MSALSKRRRVQLLYRSIVRPSATLTCPSGHTVPGRESNVKNMLRHYRVDLSIAVFVGIGLFVMMGLEALIRFAVLGVLEVSFSFDNAVVNAAVLATMSVVWQKRFMTWGVLIAVFGMRFIFPIVIVSITAHLSPLAVVQLAVQHPLEYAEKLHEAHPQIITLGGAYLLLIALTYFLEKRDPMWLRPIEARLAAIGKVDMLPLIITGTTVLVISQIKHNPQILLYGFVSMILFMVVNAFANLFEEEDTEEIEDLGRRGSGGSAAHAAVAGATGLAGFGKFMYLEAQDASFSFDGVSGAFAVSQQVVIIALGLGIGALFVRSMTLHLLRTGKLAEYRYLEHGAHWAIAALAVLMFATLFHEIPDYVTGLIGVLFIAAAVISSMIWNKKNGAGVQASLGTPVEHAAVDAQA